MSLFRCPRCHLPAVGSGLRADCRRLELANPNTNANDPNFGKILTAAGARNVQLALKYTF